jgi:hypothetical protein
MKHWIWSWLSGSGWSTPIRWRPALQAAGSHFRDTLAHAVGEAVAWGLRAILRWLVLPIRRYPSPHYPGDWIWDEPEMDYDSETDLFGNRRPIAEDETIATSAAESVELYVRQTLTRWTRCLTDAGQWIGIWVYRQTRRFADAVRNRPWPGIQMVA